MRETSKAKKGTNTGKKPRIGGEHTHQARANLSGYTRVHHDSSADQGKELIGERTGNRSKDGTEEEDQHGIHDLE